jgi:hypothetical protein
MASTRKRTTTKTGNFTKRTVTISKNGTRVTNSFRPPGGQTRRTTSVNLRTGQRRITHTTHFGGGWSKTTSQSTSIGKGRTSRSSSSGGDEFVFTFVFSFFIWLYNLILGKENVIPNKESKDVVYEQLLKMTESQQKILIYDVFGEWLTDKELRDWSEGYRSELVQKFLDYDWKNFDFDAWREKNGF